MGRNAPVFITLAKSENHVLVLRHYRHSGPIHQLQCPDIIRLFEIMGIGESAVSQGQIQLQRWLTCGNLARQLGLL